MYTSMIVLMINANVSTCTYTRILADLKTFTNKNGIFYFDFPIPKLKFHRIQTIHQKNKKLNVTV